MKKAWFCLLLALIMIMSCACGQTESASNSASDSTNSKTDSSEKEAEEEEEINVTVEDTIEGAVTIEAADATFTEAQGVAPTGKKETTSYNEASGMIRAAGVGTVITYTVPEGVSGEYDVYLTVGKNFAQYGSTPFIFTVAGSDPFTVVMDLEVAGNSPYKWTKDGDYDTGTFYDTGRFLISAGETLAAGDAITVDCEYGCRSAAMPGIGFPMIGRVTLVPAGTAVATGYDYTIKETAEADPSDPLSGLTIVWMGSSVTYGAHSGGHYSMADAIADNHQGTTCLKYAVSSTTLVNGDSSSYVSRFELIKDDVKPDLVIVQLSTNDATTNKPFGEMADGFDASTFDDTTIAGAIETIIAYCQERYNCPVVFYTGSYTVKENYADMVALLLQIQEKWGIGVVDLFNDEEMTAIYDTDLYHEYMSDEVHPFRKGYVEWWTPKFEAYLSEYLSQ